VRFVDRLSDDGMQPLVQRTVALEHPGVENSGMVLVGAWACGTRAVARVIRGARQSVDPARSAASQFGRDSFAIQFVQALEAS